MEAAVAFLCTADAALYFAALSLLNLFEDALGAMLLALALSFGMLLLTQQFRYTPALRIALSPLPFLSLLLLPFGRAWIFFVPVPLVMTLLAALDRFDWDEERTVLFMRVLIGCALAFMLPAALSTPPKTKFIVLLLLFVLLAVIGLRMLRTPGSGTRLRFVSISGALLTVAIGVSGGFLVGGALTRPDILLAPARWFFLALGWLFGKLMENATFPEIEQETYGDAVPTPSESPIPTVEPGELEQLAPQQWTGNVLPTLVTILFVILAIVLIVLLLRRRRRVTPSYVGDMEYFPEQREEKKSPARRRITLSANRVREAYRSYLLLLESGAALQLRPSETSLEVQQKAAGQPGASEAEELRELYLRARYAESGGAKDARRAEALLKAIRRSFRERQ